MILFLVLSTTLVATCRVTSGLTQSEFQRIQNYTGSNVTDVTNGQNNYYSTLYKTLLDPPAVTTHFENVRDEDVKLLEGHSTRKRKKRVYAARAAVRLGLRVIEDILDGAKPVFSGHDFRRKYQKSGGVRQMLKDFNTWVVEDVRKITEPGRGATRVGKVGDRILIARSKGPAGKPTLEVIKTKNITKGRGKNFASVMRDEITYKNL